MKRPLSNMSRLSILFALLLLVSVEGRQTKTQRRILDDRRWTTLPNRHKPVKGAKPRVSLTSESVAQPRPSVTISQVYNWYVKQCTENPLVTKSVTAGILGSVGDCLAQKLSAHLANENTPLDLRRTVTFFLCGLLYAGPFVHFWYELLFRIGVWMEKKYNVSKVNRILTQLFTDQTLGVAIYFPSYFYAFEIMESLVLKRSPTLSRPNMRLRNDLMDLLIMQYKIYPVANAVNFALVPPQLRVLFSNILSILWNMYLCTLLAK